jgi:LPXTG-motif cell wall-anchored protein
MRTLRIAAVGVAAFALALAPATPALAVVPEVITHTTTDGVETDGGATATVEQIGLRLVTPADARANFYHYFIEPGTDIEDVESLVFLGSITDLSYQTRKLDTAAGGESILPAYKMEIYCDEARPYTTLVYEPYRQDDLGPGDVDYHAWQTWDVDAGEFWSTYQIGGGFGATFGTKSDQTYQAPLEEILDLCPEAVVISFQVGQGASPNPADALADELLFEGAEFVIPILTGRAMTGTKAVKDGPDWGEPFAIKHIWRGPSPSPSPQLPSTGTGTVLPYVYVGAALVLLGTLVVLLVRRRRAEA